MKTKVLILGAGYAGILCANRLQKQNKDIEVVLISNSEFFHERIRFHELASRRNEKKMKVQDLIRKKIQFTIGKITKISPNSNEVDVKTNFGPIVYNYDYLVVSIGSQNTKTQLDGENSIQSKESLESFLKSKSPKGIGHLCILGGGLTGIEFASEWKEKYPKTNVTIVDQNLFAKSFSKLGRNYIKNKFESLGIGVIESKGIEKIEKNKIRFLDQTELHYDTLMNCTGFQVHDLLTKSGFKTNDSNQVYVDPFLRSKQYDNVYVAGDAAKLEPSHLRMGCVTALPMGAYVADTISNVLHNRNLSPFEFHFFGRCVSLGRNDGLIQWTNFDDSPKEKIIKGTLGALIKECVNRFTLISLRLEKYLPFRFYFWPQGNPQNNPIGFEEKLIQRGET
ncbi:NADH-quinone oxidoreductase subunit D [Leptospira levettii]|uniref:NAD(P)/FAD-dependent oxidoreductase n=1 Tax=Leptospira levettii TaxID=2023178 RepID=UPI000C2A7298|nr:FAD-dependent oxidoreductase [Leptospira levettii]MCW7473275.1 FAD-dependent oxidoreductase [Leptospira levettii]PJZ37701.1 NADH-quinone oxidoreductase subunit D [Leptospira levettii]PJZ90464.1 NADH-quinone oxidoreductase subunit D [Leptospira levettii]PKA01628.1 NADH-quinone oxidoreductase subunit D [Leptospira levettii]